VYHVPDVAKQQENAPATAGRLSIPLTESGLLDLDHTRASTLEKLDYILRNDPHIKEALADGTEAPDLFGGITTENVAAGLDAVNTVNGLVFRVLAAKFIKHPLLRDKDGKPLPLVLDPAILDRAFRLTDEQHAEFDPRATRLAQKYSGNLPEWLKKNLDLYMFAAMFLSYTASNAKAVLEAQIKRDLGLAQDAFSRAKAAAVKNPQPDSDAQPVNGREREAPSSVRITEVENLADLPPEGPTA